MEKKFSNWIKWENRNELPNICFPGVYCIAISEIDLSFLEFKLISEICYVGMTNSGGGIKSRLKQFDNTILGKTGHGGADRVRFKYSNYIDLIQNLYVSVCPFEANVKSILPKDLRTMGFVASFEYECIANYVENFGKLPEFNDIKLSPKYSLSQSK